MTTFTSYGEVGPRRQAEIIRELARPSSNSPADDEPTLKAIRGLLRDAGKLGAQA